MSAEERLRPVERLQGRGAFAPVFARRCRAGDALLAVHLLENGLGYSRLGVSVSKRIGDAVTRHYAKRRVREAFRRNKSALPVGFDMVCVVRKDLRGSDVAASLIALAARAKRQL